MRRSVWAAIMVLALGVTAAAQPVPEPPLPQPRPDTPVMAEEESEGSVDAAAGDGRGLPDRIYQTACPALLAGRIVGEMQPPLSENSCGLQSPIAVSALMVNGREIALPETPVTNCAMAMAFAGWAEEVDSFARATLGTRIERLSTGPGYQCRLRYGAESGFLSEHGRGNAIDIAAIGFDDGTSVSVLEDWRRLPVSSEAKFLAFAHGAACARFTTVLGPEANADHEDHFHFDLGCHGQSCTAVICE